jgi:hypothetical protein
MKTLYDPSDLEAIKQRIENLEPDSQGLWGIMNVHQMVCHVADPFRDLLKLRTTKSTIPELLKPLVRMMLINDKPFRKNIPTVKPYQQAGKGEGTAPTEFEKDRAELIKLIDEFANLDENFKLGQHAALGTLTREQAGQFMWKHLDHHLRQFGV